MVQLRVELRPERAHDVLTGGRLSAEFVCFQVEMLVLPGGEGGFGSRAKSGEIVKCSALLVVGAANRRFRQVTMPVAARIIAFAVKREVFRDGKLAGVETIDVDLTVNA